MRSAMTCKPSILKWVDWDSMIHLKVLFEHALLSKSYVYTPQIVSLI